jgi:hypothetical protein
MAFSSFFQNVFNPGHSQKFASCGRGSANSSQGGTRCGGSKILSFITFLLD